MTPDDLTAEHLTKIEDIISAEFAIGGIQCVLVIDMTGNVIVKYEDEQFNRDIYSLAALAAANYAAVNAMASAIGEMEFSLVFHKGKNENVHYSKINDSLLMVSIFEEKIALGEFRIKMNTVITHIRNSGIL